MTVSRTGDEEIVALIREIGRTVHAAGVDEEARAAAFKHLEAALGLLSGGDARLRWYEVDGSDDGVAHTSGRDLSAFSGSLNSAAPPMRIRRGRIADGRRALIGTVRLDRLREGPPRTVHGGVIAGLFDELLGGGQRLNDGPPGVTGRLTVRYRRPTPLDVDLELRVWIEDERTRRVVVRGECVVVADADGEEQLTAEAEAVFLRVDFTQLRDMMRAPTHD